MLEPEYDSPFESIVEKMSTEIANYVDEECVRAVQRIGINVDKNKLLKCLAQDRERYQEAYQRGYNNRDTEIVRCKNCRWRYEPSCPWFDGEEDNAPGEDWFCADGQLPSYEDLEEDP